MKTRTNHHTNLFFSQHLFSLVWWIIPLAGSLLSPGWVHSPPLCDLTISLEAKAVSCAGEMDGQIFITPVKGTPPYKWQWTSGSRNGKGTGTAIPDLRAGSYSVTVEDQTGCTASGNILVGQGAKIELNCTESAPVSQLGAADGKALIVIDGGSAPYTLAWSGAGNGASKEASKNVKIDGLRRGNYQLTVTDDKGCAAECSFTIDINTCNFSFAVTADPPSCSTLSDGIIKIQTKDGNPPYQWSLSGNQQNRKGTGILITDVPAGNYQVQVTDSDECMATSLVTIPAPAVHPDLSALLELYDATDGEHWSENSGWKEGKEGKNCDPCTWFGVYCNTAGRVEQMYLSGLNLNGFLPDLELPELTDLELQVNNLQGQLPDFSLLAKVELINLSENHLSGTLPDFHHLQKLETLDLSDNEIGGKIPDFKKLETLEQLYLSSNKLTGQIPDFSRFPNLRSFNLGFNQLDGSIPNFTKLPELTSIHLRGNELQGNIPNFNHLPNLSTLDLSRNKLQGELPVFSLVKNLELLILSENQLTGSIPAWDHLQALSWLYLDNNQLSGCYPASWVSGPNSFCERDPVYDFSDNPGLIDGGSRESFQNFCAFGTAACKPCYHPDRDALIALYEVTNGKKWKTKWDTTSCDPCSWFGVGCDVELRVISLDLPSNQLSGPIPNLNLPELVHLNLRANKLNGPIPNFSLMPKLEELHLGNNELEGRIPTFNALPDLTHLILKNNSLSGCYPITWVNGVSTLLCDQLIEYDFTGNPGLQPGDRSQDFKEFCEEGLAACQCDHPDFEGLMSVYNALDGPNWTNQTNWGNTGDNCDPCTWYGVNCLNERVVSLDLMANNLSGVLPSVIDLPELVALELKDNDISGSLPNLNHLPKMVYLNVSKNRLSGSIPNFSHSPDLGYLYLYENQLSGEIPDFSHIPKLSYLYLYSNNLSGEIPNFSNTPSLSYLKLQDNQLSGAIPDFSDLTLLYYLDISNNQLTGYLPGFNNMLNLRYLLLANNHLKGCYPAAWFNYRLRLCERLVVHDFSGNPRLLPGDTDADFQLFCSQGPAVCPCEHPAYEELVRLYNATDGSNWKHTKWDLEDCDVCNWPGITCNNSGQLIGIDLSANNGLKGELPDLQLSNLEELRLGANELFGLIPNFSGLPNLNKLYLRGNNFSGRIPRFNDLPKLEELILANNDLSGCFPTVWSSGDDPICGRLTQYDFTGNPQLKPGDTKADFIAFCQMGPEACDCNHPAYEALIELYDATNGPKWTDNSGWKEGKAGDNCDPCTWKGVICNGSGIVLGLDLEGNNLQSNDIHNLLLSLDLKNLISLHLGNNKLAGNIPDIPGLPSLENLWLYQNQLTGNIPDFTHLTKLQILSLAENQLEGVIPNFHQLPKLKAISLAQNRLKGEIPSFGALPELEQLLLNRNNLSGYLPVLEKCPKLIELHLADNDLEGCYPIHWFDGLDPLCGRLTGYNFTGNQGLLPGDDDASFQLFCSQGPSVCGGDPCANDTQPPKFSCPHDITLILEAGISEMAVDWPLPSVSDNCLPVEVTSNYQPGDSFPLGTTTVIYTAIDGNDNIGECRFTIQLLPCSSMDEEAPEFTYCPNDTTVVIDPEVGSIAVNWDPPQAVDNCAVTGIESTHQPGDEFGPGQTTVEYTAIDEAGNAVSCSFMINVIFDNNGCDHPDYQALVELYHATNGPDWTIGWDITDCDPCNWYGVKCNENGRVNDIVIRLNNLTGYLPDVSFPYVWRFNISLNAIEGTIPNLSGLPNVTELHLNNNRFAGAIPEFDYCPNLVLLNLHNNELGPDIPILTHLTQLNHLFMGNNLLEGCYPEEWVGTFCEQLEYRNFAGNHGLLPGDQPWEFDLFCAEGPAACIPEECKNGSDSEVPVFSYCPNDTTLFLDPADNSVVVNWNAPEVSDNCGIESLTSTHEPGTSFPLGTTTVTYTAIDSSGNSSICSFDILMIQIDEACDHPDYPALIQLYTATNGAGWSNQWDTTVCNPCNWYGISCDVNGRVQEIQLNNNNLNGQLPDAAFPYLTIFDLSNNPIGGTIPNFTGLPLLAALHLNNGQLTGDVPNLDHCLELEQIYLQNNTLNSSLPPWPHLNRLHTLNLANNQLYGCYPTEWMNTLCAQLSNYDFRDNPGLLPGDEDTDFEHFCSEGPLACVLDSCDNDTIPPVFTYCPSDTIILVESGTEEIEVSWERPIAVDSCGNVVMEGTSSLGRKFPVGETTVTYYAYDNSANQSICTFTIEVREDGSNPTATDEHRDEDRPLLHSVFPLPFRNKVSILFYLPHSEDVEINILDLAGKTIHRDRRHFSAGEQNWVLGPEQIGEDGIYFFTIRTRGGNMRGKLIRQ
ncbi:MAG: HYR domain-containing protein [Saprospiraceae bacterium]